MPPILAPDLPIQVAHTHSASSRPPPHPHNHAVDPVPPGIQLRDRARPLALDIFQRFQFANARLLLHRAVLHAGQHADQKLDLRHFEQQVGGQFVLRGGERGGRVRRRGFGHFGVGVGIYERGGGGGCVCGRGMIVGGRSGVG